MIPYEFNPLATGTDISYRAKEFVRGVFFYNSSGAANSSAMTVSSAGLTDVADSMMKIWRGGSVTTATINQNTSQIVYSGGVVFSATVNNGGGIAVSNGGVVSTVDARAGANIYVSGGTVQLLNNHNGNAHFSGAEIGEILHMSGWMSATSGNNIGRIYIYNSANCVVSSGAETALQIDSGGRAVVSSAAIISSGWISSGGILEMSHGGIVQNLDIDSGGIMKYPPVCSETSTCLTGSNALGAFFLSGGTAENLIVSSSVSMAVSFGAAANSTWIESQGEMAVSVGGIAVSTTILQGGRMYLSSGGSGESADVSSGGFVSIGSDGRIEDIMVSSGGSLYVGVGGNAINVSSQAGAVISVASYSYIRYV